MDIIAKLSNNPSLALLVGFGLLFFGWAGYFVKIFSAITGTTQRSFLLDIIIAIGFVMIIVSFILIALSAQ